MTTKHPHQNEYLIYARKSTDDADNQKNSIDYQIGECLRYAKNNTLLVADFSVDGFCDTGVIKEKHTAYKTSDSIINKDGSFVYRIERPKFKKIIDALTKKEFKGLICLCWDRISRNDQDGIIIKNLIKNGVDVRFVQTKYEQTSSGALHMDIDGMFAAHYSRVISEKVRAAYSKLRSEGKCTYSAPIGYLNHGSDNKPLDEERAPLVRQIFELYANGGWGLRQLAKWANEQGLTTKPSRKHRTRAEILAGKEHDDSVPVGRPMNEKSIELILKNPFYIGKLKIGQKIIDGIHQPLIDVSLFNKVQEVLKSKNVNIYFVDKDFYTYRGFIRCLCGRVYSPYEQKGNNYYRCNCLRTCDSTDKNLKENDINETVAEIMDKIHFTDTELAEIQERAKSELGEAVEKKRQFEVGTLEKQRQRITDDLVYLEKNKITLLRTNVYTIEQFNADYEKLGKELKEVNEKISTQNVSASEMLETVISFSELVKDAKIYYENALDREKREMATNVFYELNYHSGNLSNYKAKEGYHALLNRHSVNFGGSDGTRTRNFCRDRAVL